MKEAVLNFFTLFKRTLCVTTSDVIPRVNFLTLWVKIRMISNVGALDHKIATQQKKGFQ